METPGVSPVIQEILDGWRQRLGTEGSNQLTRLAALALGTAGDPEKDIRRVWMLVDWLMRTEAPTWLRLAGHSHYAIELENAAPIQDSSSMQMLAPNLKRISNELYLQQQRENRISLAQAVASEAAEQAVNACGNFVVYSGSMSQSDRLALGTVFLNTSIDYLAAVLVAYRSAVTAIEGIDYTAALSTDASASDKEVLAMAHNQATEAAIRSLEPTVAQIQDSALTLIERMTHI